VLPFFLVLSLTRLTRSQELEFQPQPTHEGTSLNTDLSVAPEIAQLATEFIPARRDPAAPRTDGRIAGDLADLAAVPQRWWDLVRFDQDRPLRIPVPGAPGAWLLVLPPGSAADCDCRQATALAGEAVETAGGDPADPGRPLRPGRVRVHGTGSVHRLRSAGHGYSVSLHAAVTPARSLENSNSFITNGPVVPFSSRLALEPAFAQPAFLRLRTFISLRE
jgi:hypothetical protein